MAVFHWHWLCDDGPAPEALPAFRPAGRPSCPDHSTFSFLLFAFVWQALVGFPLESRINGRLQAITRAQNAAGSAHRGARPANAGRDNIRPPAVGFLIEPVQPFDLAELLIRRRALFFCPCPDIELPATPSPTGQGWPPMQALDPGFPERGHPRAASTRFGLAAAGPCFKWAGHHCAWLVAIAAENTIQPASAAGRRSTRGRHHHRWPRQGRRGQWRKQRAWRGQTLGQLMPGLAAHPIRPAG